MAEDAIRFEWLDGPESEGPRRATEEEWSAIDEVCAANKWMALNRTLTRILVAYRGEKMIGFHVMQLLPHAEPAWVDEAERGTGLPSQLADQMVAFLQGVNARGWMVLAGNAHTEKLCRDRGMKKIASAVYMTQ
jgi:hypothetical protein